MTIKTRGAGSATMLPASPSLSAFHASYGTVTSEPRVPAYIRPRDITYYVINPFLFDEQLYYTSSYEEAQAYSYIVSVKMDGHIVNNSYGSFALCPKPSVAFTGTPSGVMASYGNTHVPGRRWDFSVVIKRAFSQMYEMLLYTDGIYDITNKIVTLEYEKRIAHIIANSFYSSVDHVTPTAEFPATLCSIEQTRTEGRARPTHFTALNTYVDTSCLPAIEVSATRASVNVSVPKFAEAYTRAVVTVQARVALSFNTSFCTTTPAALQDNAMASGRKISIRKTASTMSFLTASTLAPVEAFAAAALYAQSSKTLYTQPPRYMAPPLRVTPGVRVPTQYADDCIYLGSDLTYLIRYKGATLLDVYAKVGHIAAITPATDAHQTSPAILRGVKNAAYTSTQRKMAALRKISARRITLVHALKDVCSLYPVGISGTRLSVLTSVRTQATNVSFAAPEILYADVNKLSHVTLSAHIVDVAGNSTKYIRAARSYSVGVIIADVGVDYSAVSYGAHAIDILEGTHSTTIITSPSGNIVTILQGTHVDNQTSPYAATTMMPVDYIARVKACKSDVSMAQLVFADKQGFTNSALLPAYLYDVYSASATAYRKGGAADIRILAGSRVIDTSAFTSSLTMHIAATSEKHFRTRLFKCAVVSPAVASPTILPAVDIPAFHMVAELARPRVMHSMLQSAAAPEMTTATFVVDARLPAECTFVTTLASTDKARRKFASTVHAAGMLFGSLYIDKHDYVPASLTYVEHARFMPDVTYALNPPTRSYYSEYTRIVPEFPIQYRYISMYLHRDVAYLGRKFTSEHNLAWKQAHVVHDLTRAGTLKLTTRDALVFGVKPLVNFASFRRRIASTKSVGKAVLKQVPATFVTEPAVRMPTSTSWVGYAGGSIVSVRKQRLYTPEQTFGTLAISEYTEFAGHAIPVDWTESHGESARLTACVNTVGMTFADIIGQSPFSTKALVVDTLTSGYRSWLARAAVNVVAIEHATPGGSLPSMLDTHIQTIGNVYVKSPAACRSATGSLVTVLDATFGPGSSEAEGSVQSVISSGKRLGLAVVRSQRMVDILSAELSGFSQSDYEGSAVEVSVSGMRHQAVKSFTNIIEFSYGVLAAFSTQTIVATITDIGATQVTRAPKVMTTAVDVLAGSLSGDSQSVFPAAGIAVNVAVDIRLSGAGVSTVVSITAADFAGCISVYAGVECAHMETLVSRMLSVKLQKAAYTTSVLFADALPYSPITASVAVQLSGVLAARTFVRTATSSVHTPALKTVAFIVDKRDSLECIKQDFFGISKKLRHGSITNKAYIVSPMAAAFPCQGYIGCPIEGVIQNEVWAAVEDWHKPVPCRVVIEIELDYHYTEPHEMAFVF